MKFFKTDASNLEFIKQVRANQGSDVTNAQRVKKSSLGSLAEKIKRIYSGNSNNLNGAIAEYGDTANEAIKSKQTALNDAQKEFSKFEKNNPEPNKDKFKKEITNDEGKRETVPDEEAYNRALKEWKDERQKYLAKVEKAQQELDAIKEANKSDEQPDEAVKNIPEKELPVDTPIEQSEEDKKIEAGKDKAQEAINAVSGAMDSIAAMYEQQADIINTNTKADQKAKELENVETTDETLENFELQEIAPINQYQDPKTGEVFDAAIPEMQDLSKMSVPELNAELAKTLRTIGIINSKNNSIQGNSGLANANATNSIKKEQETQDENVNAAVRETNLAGENLEATQKEGEDLEVSKTDTDKKIGENQKAQKSTTSSIGKTENKIKGLQNKITGLKKVVSQVKTLLKAAEIALEIAEASVSLTGGASAAEIAALKAQIKAFEEQLAAVEKVITATEGAISAANGDLSKLTGLLAEQVAEGTDLEQALGEIDTNLAKNLSDVKNAMNIFFSSKQVLDATKGDSKQMFTALLSAWETYENNIKSALDGMATSNEGTKENKNEKRGNFLKNLLNPNPNPNANANANPNAKVNKPTNNKGNAAQSQTKTPTNGQPQTPKASGKKVTTKKTK